MIILKVTIKQGFILSLEDTFLENQRGGIDPPAFSVNNLSFDKLFTWRSGYKQRKLETMKSTES